MSAAFRKPIIIAAAAIVLLPLLFWGTAEVTSRPKFCSSCHYMVPFYESWKASAHSDVSCTKCHFEPGLTGKIKGKLNGLYQLTKYVSMAYKKSKPWAEISDKSCMREGCHQTQNLEGPLEFKMVKFDHSAHLGKLRRGKQLQCTSCHSQMVQGEHILVTEGTCFICHMKDRTKETRLSACTTCHTPEIFLERGSQLRYNHTSVVESGKSCETCHINTIEGNAPVPLQMCINCHWQTDFFERFDDPEFLHANHVTNNRVECTACHTPITHSIRRVHQLTGEDCRSCHQDMHAAQTQLFTGISPHGAPAIPNPMFEVGLSCQSCHMFHKENLRGGETMISKPEACDTCHGTGYSHLLQNWEKRLEHQQSNLRRYITMTSALLADTLVDGDYLSTELLKAETNLDLVRTAKGIHNIKLSDDLLAEAHITINHVLEATGNATKVEPYYTTDDLLPSDCANCHFGIEEARLVVFGLQFPHQRHLTHGVSCNKCHSNLEEHGELLLNRSECLNCHHSQEDTSCGTCHAEQQQLLQGTTPFMSGEADLMWDADISCKDCHLVETGTVRRGTAICADCHDEDYPDLVEEYRENIEGLLNQPGMNQAAVRWLRDEGSLGGHNPAAVIEYLEGH